MLPLSLIAALADNNVIGINNQLPWHLPADLKHFKQLTLDKPVIMGRKTWQSLGKALPNRLNVVVSRHEKMVAEGAHVYATPIEAIKFANQWAIQQGATELMLIGGAQLYQLALSANLVSKMYLTRVHLRPEGDTFFPNFDQLSWQKVDEQHFPSVEDKPAYTFEYWQR